MWISDVELDILTMLENMGVVKFRLIGGQMSPNDYDYYTYEAHEIEYEDVSR